METNDILFLNLFSACTLLRVNCIVYQTANDIYMNPRKIVYRKAMKLL